MLSKFTGHLQAGGWSRSLVLVFGFFFVLIVGYELGVTYWCAY